MRGRLRLGAIVGPLDAHALGSHLDVRPGSEGDGDDLEGVVRHHGRQGWHWAEEPLHLALHHLEGGAVPRAVCQRGGGEDDAVEGLGALHRQQDTGGLGVHVEGPKTFW